MTMGVAVLGAGRIGGSYIGVVKQTAGVEMLVVAEPRDEQTAPLREKHPEVEFVKDFTEALAYNDVQIAIGALPHGLHKQAALDAASAGKHIFMEKPLAIWLSEADEMLAAAKANDVRLMTAHTQRYYPVVKAMKQIVDSKRLGDPIMAHDTWHKPFDLPARPAWMLDRERGGGMGLMDGTHQIDRLLWLIGLDIETVSARIGAFAPSADQGGRHRDLLPPLEIGCGRHRESPRVAGGRNRNRGGVILHQRPGTVSAATFCRSVGGRHARRHLAGRAGGDHRQPGGRILRVRAINRARR